MARYFFHTDSHTRFTDDEGQELSSLTAARAYATRAIAEVLRDDSKIFWGTRPWSMTVTDADGLIFFAIEVHGVDAPVSIGKA